MTVYHIGTSQSERIAWLCEELALPYTLRRFDREPATPMAPADCRSLRPMGVALVIRDGDLVLAPYGAIADYLMQKYADGRPSVGLQHDNFPAYLSVPLRQRHVHAE